MLQYLHALLVIASYHALKVFNVEDTILHVSDRVFEAMVFLGNWCYNMNIG